jgi:hypothetical protein
MAVVRGEGVTFAAPGPQLVPDDVTVFSPPRPFSLRIYDSFCITIEPRRIKFVLCKKKIPFSAIFHSYCQVRFRLGRGF